tara:strand:- start:61 stop:558 length:498 start_codon:yes stop_codon:yes gene_type:complete
MSYHIGKRPEELQLKEGPYRHYEEILHGALPSNWDDLMILLDAMDYVIREWCESMIPFGLIEMAEEVAQELYTHNMTTRFAIYSFLNEDEEEAMDFVDVMKKLNKLKQAYVPLAKSYAKVPSLSHWYLNLPMRVATSFKTIRQLERDKARLKLEYTNGTKGALFK